MAVPAKGDVLALDQNFRSAAGGVSNADPETIVALRVDPTTKRLLVDISPFIAAGATVVLVSQIASFYFNEVTADDDGFPISYGSTIAWVNFINDDDTDSVWIRLGSVLASTNSSIAFRVDPGGLLDIGPDRMKAGITNTVLTTLPATAASIRIAAGLL